MVWTGLLHLAGLDVTIHVVASCHLEENNSEDKADTQMTKQDRNNMDSP